MYCRQSVRGRQAGRQAAWLPRSEQEAAAAGERPGRRCWLAPSEVLPSQEGETFASAGTGQRMKKSKKKKKSPIFCRCVKAAWAFSCL